MVEAQVAARGLRHNYIGTEHLLLGLLAQRDRIPAQALAAQGVDADRARSCLMTIVRAGEEEVTGQIPFTPRAKKTLELALRESLGAGNREVAPQHLLLGLLREGEGVASQILSALGVDAESLRKQIIMTLPPPGEVMREAHRRGPASPRVEVGFVLEPSADVRRLLMSAGARALDDGRTEIEVRDVEEALRRRGDSQEPPQASTA
ncbi:MAG TPA: Clp protease N-terminal domain-containing protein [Solirubrobacteraceae bacterium]|nr:Clp protease N-terminal domain-containing protein [Solirubrobacteraceae bacterium]